MPRPAQGWGWISRDEMWGQQRCRWGVPAVGMSLQGRMVVGLRDGDSWIPITLHSAKSDRAGRCQGWDLSVAGSWHSRMFVEGFGAVWLPRAGAGHGGAQVVPWRHCLGGLSP